jgi:hypothetical protein
MSVISKGGPIFFRLWGIPFVLAGLYIVFGRFMVDARARAHTFYAVTNERIIIVGGRSARQTKSMQLRTLSDISLTEHKDGSGSITFGPQGSMARLVPPGWPGSGQYSAPAFEMIDRAKEVFDLIGQAQKKST